MTGWNLPPGCEVSDLPGNSAGECDECESELWPDDAEICKLCDGWFCSDCINNHRCTEVEDEEEEDER